MMVPLRTFWALRMRSCPLTAYWSEESMQSIYKLPTIKLSAAMNDLVIDRRLFLHNKKKNQARSLLPEIKYPPAFNINGSNILRRFNDDPPLRQRSQCQPPLSNILVSKRITPANPEESPLNPKTKKHNVSIVRRDSSNKLVIDSEPHLEGPRKTSTSLSQRVRRRNLQKSGPSTSAKEDQKIVKVGRNQEYVVVFGKGNNNEQLVREILLARKTWRQAKWGECTPHLKWVFSKERHNYKKMWSFTQTRAINHFQFNEEITTKDNLIKNLQIFCETRKIEIFTVTPITFIVDFDDQYCEYNLKQFLSFYHRNDPRKNTSTSPTRRAPLNSPTFVGKFQQYMGWQNSDIKKKVNILSRPVNFNTYFTEVEESGEASYVWIFKPTGLNRGRGIQIFDSLEQLEKILLEYLSMMNRKSYKEVRQTKDIRETKDKAKQKDKDNEEMMESGETQEETQEGKFCTEKFKLSTCSFVIQKYVERPFLIDRRKFDIRVWALLTHSMDVYFFKEGYIRTSTEEFSVKDIDNYFIHLTNNAIQKNSSTYGQFQSGNQLPFRELSKFIGVEQTEKVWARMQESTHMVFSSVKKKINQHARRFCFELFGMDFILDAQLKTWLIEVNQNPCLQCSSPLLGKIVPRMINDAFKLTVDQIFGDKKLTEKAYPVEGRADNENLWEHLGQLLPNAQFSPQKQMPFKI